MHNRTFVEFKLKNVKWLFKASYKKSDSNICRLRRTHFCVDLKHETWQQLSLVKMINTILSENNPGIFALGVALPSALET